MTTTSRVSLTVTSEAPIPLGPLSVEIIPESGDPIQFVLSSNHPEHVVEVPPGRPLTDRHEGGFGRGAHAGSLRVRRHCYRR